ncbi:MAG: domain S-box protein [Acidobacteriales bacterium]|nr:domain S-box protein [Terriglobales bacterium]
MQSAPVHSVHFYGEHKALIDRLCGIVASGLQVGNSILIVASEEHRTSLVNCLEEVGVDVRSTARSGRFVMLDAGETLGTFMVDGHPDGSLFKSSVGKILADIRRSARDGGLTVFGEMVTILWERGNREAALKLESLWNEALNDRAFHLHCAYPRWSLLKDQDQEIAAICGNHSHVAFN